MKLSKHLSNTLTDKLREDSFNMSKYDQIQGLDVDIKNLFIPHKKQPKTKYYIANTALKVIDLISINKQYLDWSVLWTTDHTYFSILYKGMVIDVYFCNGIFATTVHWIHRTEGDSIDIYRQNYVISRYTTLINKANCPVTALEIYKIIAFLFKSEKILKVLEVKSKYKEGKSTPILNDTNQHYIMVGSEWNTNSTIYY